MKFIPSQENDLGLGTKITENNIRLISKQGNYRITRKGDNSWTHPYQALVEMPWSHFLLCTVLFYACINFIFAMLYMAIGTHGLSGEVYPDFWQNFEKAYFFSAQTFTTVGYGAVAPVCISANGLAAMEALVGLMVFALATGLFYARFSRPSIKIGYSEKILITPYKGITALMFRIVNQQHTQVIEVEVQVTMSYLEVINGTKQRLYKTLSLERNRVSLFPMNWTIVHPIDEDSPMSGWSKEALKEKSIEIIIFIKAYDATFAQQIHSNGSYIFDEFVWDKKFASMYYADEELGTTILEMDKLNLLENI
jgi:inward rectifier potassium channel